MSKRNRRHKANSVTLAVAPETNVGDPPPSDWANLSANSFEANGPPIQQLDVFMLLAGSMYAIEQGKADLRGIEIDRTWGINHRPYSIRLVVSSDTMPMLHDMGGLQAQHDYCERVSQWFAQQAIHIAKLMKEPVKK